MSLLSLVLVISLSTLFFFSLPLVPAVASQDVAPTQFTSDRDGDPLEISRLRIRSGRYDVRVCCCEQFDGYGDGVSWERRLELLRVLQ